MNQKLTARRLWCLALAAAVGLSGCGKAAGAQPAQAETQTAAAQTLEEDSRPSAGGGEDKKTETVYVNLDASGRPYAATVSDWLHSSRPDVAFTDRSDLENIQNIKGEQQPQREGEDLVWQLEGSDLYYQGTSEKPLPLGVQITYRLDGQQLNPQALAGRSGKLEMTLEFENKSPHTATVDGREETLYTPIMAAPLISREDQHTAADLCTHDPAIVVDTGDHRQDRIERKDAHA